MYKPARYVDQFVSRICVPATADVGMCTVPYRHHAHGSCQVRGEPYDGTRYGTEYIVRGVGYGAL